ncbi:MAG: ABC transporter permease, partial [Bacteroidales bacterium]
MLAGIFEDLPENTTYKYDLIFSMSSIGNYMGDGSENLMGNDRYIGFIKSSPGVTPEELEQSVQQNVEEYVLEDVKEEFKRSGFEYTLTLKSLDKIHEADKSVRQMKLILLLLAIMLIVTATMNYLLLVISVIISRAKQVAVFKCYGAGRRELIGMALTESFIYLCLAVILGLILLLLMQNQITEILNVSLQALFLSKGMLFIMLTIFALFILTALITASIYQNIPIAAAFRNMRMNKRIWKLTLLFIQFIAVGVLLPLLCIVNRQYSFMVNDKPGYEYENLAYIPISGVDSAVCKILMDGLTRIPEVDDVTEIFQLPFKWCSGNNIKMPGNTDELFNIADFYFTKSNYFALMEIPIVEGSSFSGGNDQIMVDRNFVDKMREIGKWDKSSPIGKSILVTEHGGPFTVCGVYENIRMGKINHQDKRPSVMFPPSQRFLPQYIVIKYQQMSPDALLRTHNLVDGLILDQVNSVIVWKIEMEHLYVDSYRFRNAVLIGFITTLLIVIIGMIGFMQDELNRRRKEIAIRII